MNRLWNWLILRWHYFLGYAKKCDFCGELAYNYYLYNDWRRECLKCVSAALIQSDVKMIVHQDKEVE